MKKLTARKPLRLDVQTVRTLTPVVLETIVAGAAPSASCQPKYSCTGGCGMTA